MSGSVRNVWSRYLNGGTAQYNFSYHSELPTASNPTASNPITSNPTASNPHASNPTASNPTASNPTVPLDESKSKRNNTKVPMSIQKGGKRKSKRVTKKYRLAHQTRRKHRMHSK